MQNKPVSNCCKTELVTNQSDEGTSYYSCSKCNNACDPMQNEPQLSSEMERRFDELLKPLFVIGSGYFEHHSGVDNTKEVEAIKHFLTTALEEQKQKLLSEVESWLVDEMCEVPQCPYRHDSEGKKQYRAELRAKVQEMKEGK